MRLILLALLALPVAAVCQSKKALPSFGKISKEELQSTTCEFDKDAEAMVLYESGILTFDLDSRGFHNELVHHVRIKILNDKGTDLANIKLRFNSKLNAEGISNLSANTYNIDEAGNIITTRLDKNLVYRKRINDDISENAFTMPAVKTGSVIEYKYTWRGFDRRSWNLQRSIPVQYSRYEVNFPSMFELFIRPSCSLPFSSTDESTSLRTIKQFTMKDIPALRNEKYISCEDDYLQRIDSWIVAYTLDGMRYTTLKTWPQLAEEMLESDYIGEQLKKRLSGIEDLKTALDGITDPFRRMVTVHNYVRKNMTWNEIDNYRAADGVKSAWKDKKGTSGDINLILINLLNDAGLDVKPILVSTRSNGRITTLFPDRSQFNKLLAFVKVKEQTYVLDAVDKVTPAGMIPYDVMFTEGLVLDASNTYKFSWQPIWDPSRLEKNVVMYQASLDEAGEIKGHATVMSYDYARTKRAKSLEDKESYKQKFFDVSTSGLAVENLIFKNEQADTLPLIQELDFAGRLNSSGEYSFFTTNLFSGLGSNPFIADTRFSDVFYGTNQNYTIISSLRIPQGYSYEELPKNIKISLQDKSIEVTRMMAVTGSSLSAKLVIEFKRPFYTPEEYPDLKAFYKKMYELMDEQIIIKKNSKDQAKN